MTNTPTRPSTERHVRNGFRFNVIPSSARDCIGMGDTGTKDNVAPIRVHGTYIRAQLDIGISKVIITFSNKINHGHPGVLVVRCKRQVNRNSKRVPNHVGCYRSWGGFKVDVLHFALGFEDKSHGALQCLRRCPGG